MFSRWRYVIWLDGWNSSSIPVQITLPCHPIPQLLKHISPVALYHVIVNEVDVLEIDMGVLPLWAFNSRYLMMCFRPVNH